MLATANRDKARELAALLTGIPYHVLDLTDVIPVIFPPEGTSSYAENALGKARAVAAATGSLALADDSGIEVDALGGRPGLLSARYGGEGLSDAERCDVLLSELRGVPSARRTARYRCVVALCSPTRGEVTVEGAVEGTVLTEPRGTGGFGYDPLFYYPPLRATFAEITADAKHQVSHRARAMAEARQILLDWAAADRR